MRGRRNYLALALAACPMKNIERLGKLMELGHETAHVTVIARRQDTPRHRTHHEVRSATNGPDRRVQLLHPNLRH